MEVPREEELKAEEHIVVVWREAAPKGEVSRIRVLRGPCWIGAFYESVWRVMRALRRGREDV